MFKIEVIENLGVMDKKPLFGRRGSYYELQKVTYGGKTFFRRIKTDGKTVTSCSYAHEKDATRWESALHKML
jgi:hypothetical protein